MIRFTRVVTVFAAVGVASGLALAVELKPFQTEAKEKFDTEVEAPLKAVNEACGTKLTVKTNFEQYKEADWAGQSISARCQSVLEAVQGLCERKAYKTSIASKIKEVHCLFGGKPGDTNEKTLVNMSVTGSAMVFKMHANNVNIQDLAKKTLEDFVNK